MTLDLDRLEAVAKAATPGPWSRFRPDATELHDIVGPTCDEDGIVIYAECDSRDAEHVVAFNPAVALELIAEVRRRRSRGGDLYVSRGEARRERDAAVAALDRVRALHTPTLPGFGPKVCAHDGRVWPWCPTIAAIEGGDAS